MDIRVHPDQMWGAVFSLPASLVDQYLLSSTPEQLRVLLWVFRHAAEQPTIEKLADAMHWSVQQTEKAVHFWQEKGILVSDVQPKQALSAPVKKEAARSLPEVSNIKPTPADIAQRIREDKMLAGMLTEAQKKFGRTLGYEGQCTILCMYDTYGLPVDVIMIILEYCREIGKTGNHYVAEMGRNWASEEIDTMDKAVEKVNKLRQCTALWTQLASYAGLSASKPTAVQSEYLRIWHYELGFSIEMIELAYDEMANHCARLSFPYINKVLQNWHSKGIKTPAQAAEAKADYQKKQSADPQASPASYDIDALEKQLWSDPIEFE